MQIKYDKLLIKCASENNLKGIDLEIPHNRFSVVTGRSGSGKSSLAFSTVYAEGQRRYIETFSPYTRQFFDKVKKPDALSMENVRPALAIQQRTRIKNSRSTVGSLTNINEYLRLLWTHISSPCCPECQSELRIWDPKSVFHFIEGELKERYEHFVLAAPLQITKKSQQALEVERLRTLGFSRILDLKTGLISEIENLSSKKTQNNYAVALDRFKSQSLREKRVLDALSQGFELGLGKIILLAFTLKGPFTKYDFEARYTCPNSNCHADTPKVPTVRPALFSYNHPIGACPECKGFGKILEIDPALCIPNPNLSLADGAIAPWEIRATPRERKKLKEFCKQQGIPFDRPWQKLKASEREALLHHRSKSFKGIIPWFEMLERKAYKMHVRVFLSRYRSQFECQNCHGSRLGPQALQFRVSGKSLPELWDMPLQELLPWIKEHRSKLHAVRKDFRELGELFDSIESRLKCLIDLGLPYLQLGRQARTLSGGETQRVNLAGAIGSNLVSTQFVLDEPSVGLHARDSGRLIQSVRQLAEQGNSVLVVEHDPETVGAAEHIIEIGPEAGSHGGQVTFCGERADWDASAIFNAAVPKFSKRTVSPGENSALKVQNASRRNLKSVSCLIPQKAFSCITGVSGSGKSTLVSEVIMQAFKAYEYGLKPGEENLVEGFELFDEISLVDQSPLSKSPRANIATYSGIWDLARDLLAQSDDAQLRRLSKSSFSFNVDAGRCLSCKGAGHIREDMQFLSDVYIPCEVCLGKRFQPEVLEVHYKGKNVDDLLNMSVSDTLEFFEGNRKVLESSEILSKLGLGYLRLGHSLSELSGGEAQRLKLVPFLKDKQNKSALLIFDEPTTGLHPKDIHLLIDLFNELCEKGHTILCIEHNPTLILSSDWIIDLGPEGGADGGKIVQQGLARDFLECRPSAEQHTARHLQLFLKTIKNKNQQHKAKTDKCLPFTAERDPSFLEIRGAREHNLKNIDVKVPLNQLVAITGVSGSGKSTIAKDIIFAEGQRRYLDCLSPYARQFIKELKRPEIASIENVKPTICVHQHTFRPSRLSTLATLSEVYNHLRLLYAKVGTQYCPDHPEVQISSRGAEDIAQEIKQDLKGQVEILAPIIKGKKGYHKEVFQRAIELEIDRVRVDGVMDRPSEYLEGLERNKAHDIELCVAKFNSQRTPIDLIKEAVRQALLLGSGSLILLAEGKERVFSSDRSCSKCRRGFFKPDPEDLSFNSRRGVCAQCAGTGKNKKATAPCPGCGGSRISSLGQNIRLGNLNIHQACLLTSGQLLSTLESLSFPVHQTRLMEPILRELRERLQALSALGLDYLPLDRDCSMLSSGELQRLRLSAAMGTPLSGAMYIFDEPSVGLHPSDNGRVLHCLRALQQRGNSILVIEHDPETILACDQIIDVGPQGGSRGGQIVFSGSIEDCLNKGNSPSAQVLRDASRLPCVEAPVKASGHLLIKGSCNNLSNISLRLPLGNIVTIAGVSGAGKSSLVHGIIAETLQNGIRKENSWQLEGNLIESSCDIRRVLLVDQQPVGKTSRSTPASYLGIWDEVRQLFASSIEAKTRGFNASYFSYNTGKGSCHTCKGQGTLKMEMSFLADARVECEACQGGRFSDEADSILFFGKRISQILKLTFEEAAQLFMNHRRIHKVLHKACELGLGYLSLGQSSATLSGGESQRLKLVNELSSSRSDHSLYILDEPSTGLHKSDVALLIKVLKELRSKGNSVLLIEHDSDILFASDQVLELGPGPGKQGGKIIFQGSPEALLGKNTPWGQVLQTQFAA